MGNVNLMTDRAIQQLRKQQCGLVYTVLNEMYVDPRIRENTDIFIRCQDTALNPGGLQAHKPQGHNFEWMIYPMSARMMGNGNTYRDTGQAIGPISVPMREFWGMIDTLERQAVGQTSYGKIEKPLINIPIKDTPEIQADKYRWAWVDKKIDAFYKLHGAEGDEIEISSKDLKYEFGVADTQWGYVVRLIKERIPGIETRGRASSRYPTKFIIPNRVLQ